MATACTAYEIAAEALPLRRWPLGICSAGSNTVMLREPALTGHSVDLQVTSKTLASTKYSKAICAWTLDKGKRLQPQELLLSPENATW